MILLDIASYCLLLFGIACYISLYVLLLHDIDVILMHPGPIKKQIWDTVHDIELNPVIKTEYGYALKKLNIKNHSYELIDTAGIEELSKDIDENHVVGIPSCRNSQAIGGRG